MTTENNLINKTYYQTIIDESIKEHPIMALGKTYMEEMQKEQPDLSSIRFAQGEVYFLNKDYEAAIYKWQHPLEEQLIPWAQKNIADAHMELGLLDYAEKFYKEVETGSVTLKSEVLLQLFSLYVQQEKTEKAVDTIKDAVKLEPDFSDVAKNYFEDIEDWDSAVELAVEQAIRTESLGWFDVLENYASLNHTSNFRPNYFNEVLTSLLYIDTYRFERLTKSLWNSYEQSDFYFQWLEEVNELLLNHQLERSYTWKQLPSLFKNAYFYLISGKFLLKDISSLIQDHLTNWLELSTGLDSLDSATAIIAWNERFPSELATALIHEAEQKYKNLNPNQNNKQDGIVLLESIKKWAEKEGLLDRLTEFMEPMLDEHHLEVASPTEIRNVIKDSLNYISDQRTELENNILQEMKMNGDLRTELASFQELMGKMEKDNANTISSSFHDFKTTFISKIQMDIPKLLRDCTDLVKEDDNFSKLHIVLNEEMNKRIAQYMEETALPDFKLAFQEWKETSEKAFQDSQKKCTDFTQEINEQWQAENFILEGDFQVLGDWERDIERISRGLLRFEEINIFLRNNPSQLLLKGAGKLFGSLSRNRDILLNRYKDYIKNADYSEIAEEIIQTFVQQLELFEQSLDWDISRFFSGPQEELRRFIEEVDKTIENHSQSLHEFRENPEIYEDPITLFEIKLRHYELVNGINILKILSPNS